MTLDVYAQALDSAEREAGEWLGARFSRAGMNRDGTGAPPAGDDGVLA